MTTNIVKGDYVRIRDLADYPHIGIVDNEYFIHGTLKICLLSGNSVARRLDKVEKLSDAESMLFKLESA